MAPESDPEVRPWRTPSAALAALLLLVTLAAGLAQGAQAQTRPIERRDEQEPVPEEAVTRESPVYLPPFPRGEDLVELDDRPDVETVGVLFQIRQHLRSIWPLVFGQCLHGGQALEVAIQGRAAQAGFHDAVRQIPAGQDNQQ